MAHLKNIENDLNLSLSPAKVNKKLIKCSCSIITSQLSLDFEETRDKNISLENIEYLRKFVSVAEKIEDYEDEKEIFSFYPIDLFIKLDIYKSNNNILWINLSVPIGVYSNSKESGYELGFNFSVTLKSLVTFFNNFLLEFESLGSK